MAEKGLILVRVIMTVIYGHVIHSLRSVTTHRQHATFSEHLTELSARITESERRITAHYTELVERTASELSVRFTEHPALTELAHVTETVEMHTRTLTELMALPGLLEQLRQTIGAQVHAVVQQEMQAELTAHTEQYRTPPNTTRPKLSVVEANTEHRTPIFSTRRMSRVSPFHPPISARFGKHSSESKPPSHERSTSLPFGGACKRMHE